MRALLYVTAGAVTGALGFMAWLYWYFRNVFR